MSAASLEPTPVWHGEGVTVGRVLAELNAIRDKFARAEAGDSELLHPRNCVMTLVGVAPTDALEVIAKSTTKAIGMLHPAQAIVIREQPPVRGRHLDAWISTDVQRPETLCAVECELVTLHVHGRAADHLGALLDPLLVSGVPTYLWWLGTPPFGKRELFEALGVCDGLVVDSSGFDEPFHSFHGMSRLLRAAHHRLGLADLQWARMQPWRESVAQFFTPADRRPFLRGISEVGIDYAGEGRGNRIAAALATGWLASALGWNLRRASAGPGGVVAAVYEAAGRSIDVQFRSVIKADRVSGQVCAVRLAGMAEGRSFRVSVAHDPARRRGAAAAVDVERRRGDTGRVLLTMIEIGDAEPLRHVQQLQAEDVAALLLNLLSTGTHDDVYNRSLAAASELMSRL